jgi:pSer/pThr/pTyr-binding forkhead associated (FHA) protein
VGKSLSLKVIEGDQVGKIFEVTKEKIFLGRLNSDVILSDPAVSRQHAAIERHEDEFLFHDLKSRNGSYINGERVESKILVGDDAIKIGRTVLKVFIR